MPSAIAPEKPTKNIFRQNPKEYWRLYAAWWRKFKRTDYNKKHDPIWKQKWRENNREKSRKSILDWEKRNVEKKRATRRISEQNRRARKKSQKGIITSGRIQELLSIQNKKCAACKNNFGHSGFHIDHIIALSKGGLHDDKNIQLLCADCNMRKHNLDPIVFMQKMGYLL